MLTVNTLGLYRVKNEDRWIAESLERTLEVAEHVFVFDDHSTDKTVEIVGKFPRTTLVVSPFDTFDEARDKTFLLKTALESVRTGWIAFIDGDEVLTKKAVQEVRQITEYGSGGIYAFRIAYLWDSPNQERCDSVYGKYFRPRLFSIFDQPKPSELVYKTTKHNGNLHCQQVPANYKIGKTHTATGPIKHYGYMREMDRLRKHAWYNSIDSEEGRRREGNYDHVLGKPNQWAPGPLELRPFNDD